MKTLLIFGTIAFAVFIGCILYYRITFINRCPNCKQANSQERIARPLLFKSLLFFIPSRAYICYACMKRFVVIGHAEKAKTVATEKKLEV
ncbi:hypothetical protein [Spirosoma terrae]|uniref:Uncharacterized protein n=1 Tax=Spirosoma terrae TaxID=1968276 RepID=A0A6L9LCL6_9BACT|nr:hypothetical protein [Spirosoma terrae]NDU98294.1 hypothetical protein [Spirosoma terrae]